MRTERRCTVHDSPHPHPDLRVAACLRAMLWLASDAVDDVDDCVWQEVYVIPVREGMGSWGISSSGQLLRNMQVVDNLGDWQECIDALEWLVVEADTPPGLDDALRSAADGHLHPFTLRTQEDTDDPR